MIATDTYADYDGLTIYTTKRAVAAPQPKWPDLTVELLLQVSAPPSIVHISRRLL